MPDKMTPQQRHNCMSHIRSTDTKPEMIVRRWLWTQGYRYRLHVKRLPGTPDIVIHRFHTVININGCFWHGHTDCKRFKLPQSNVEFWRSKIERNRRRDAANADLLSSMGWWVITIWECQLEPTCRQATLINLSRQLSSIYLHICKAHPDSHSIHAEPAQLAAEPEATYNPTETAHSIE